MNPTPFLTRQKRRGRTLLGLLTLGMAFVAGPALAQETLRWIVPFPAGGAADSFSRVLVEKLRDEMQANIIVENRAGASTRLAAQTLAQAKPDGRTVLVTLLDTMVIAPLVYDRPGYDAEKDFAPITMVTEVTYGVAASADGPHDSLKGFLAAAETDRKQAFVGISGLGSTLHFLAFDFARSSKVDLTVVPYQGGPAMVTGLLGGDLPVAMDGLGVFVNHHRGGRVRVLAVSGEQRAVQLPEVPTFKELGLPSLSFGSAYALYAPAGTPPDQIDRWNKAMRAVLAQPEVQERLQSIGYQALSGSTPEEVTALQQKMTAHWGPIIQATGFKGE